LDGAVVVVRVGGRHALAVLLEVGEESFVLVPPPQVLSSKKGFLAAKNKQQKYKLLRSN
jgi:hypothetical protein